MRDTIARYRKNYIGEMRKVVGHAPLMVTGCGVIIENDMGEILLQKRRDNGCWALLGGSMEIGEKLTGIVFKTTSYSGTIQNNTEEAFEHRFFDKENLPDNINEFDKRYIIDWARDLQDVIVD